MDMPTYHILWPAAAIALPGLKDLQVSASYTLYIPAEFMQSSQLHLNNFNQQSHLLIDQQHQTWPAATMALPNFKDFQVSVSLLFIAIANTLHVAE